MNRNLSPPVLLRGFFSSLLYFSLGNQYLIIVNFYVVVVPLFLSLQGTIFTVGFSKLNRNLKETM